MREEYPLFQTGAELSTLLDKAANAPTQLDILQAAYPIGIVCTTAVATDPSELFGFGTWTQIGKDFAEKYSGSLANFVTLNTTNCTSATGSITWLPRSLMFTLSLTPNVAITDSTLEMFTFDLAKLGITKFADNRYLSQFSDAGNAVVSFRVTTAGVFSTYDVIVRGSSTASLATGYTLTLQFQLPVYWTGKLDAMCDKFYWKRTA